MRKSRLSQYKQYKLIELFVAGVTARTAAELVGVNKSTAAYYFHRLRLLIFQNSPHLEILRVKNQHTKDKNMMLPNNHTKICNENLGFESVSFKAANNLYRLLEQSKYKKDTFNKMRLVELISTKLELNAASIKGSDS